MVLNPWSSRNQHYTWHYLVIDYRDIGIEVSDENSTFFTPCPPHLALMGALALCMAGRLAIGWKTPQIFLAFRPDRRRVSHNYQHLMHKTNFVQ